MTLQDNAGKTGHSRLAIIAGVALFAAISAYYCLRPRLVLGDPDIWWHVHIGKDIIANRMVPYVDQYSYTFEGQPWIAKEWLSQVLLGAAHDVGGWSGVMLLSVFATTAALLACFLELSRHFRITVAAVITAVIGFVLTAVVVGRPHLFTLPIMVVFTVRLFRASAEQRPPEYRLLALVVLWANLHGSFTLALMIAGFAFFDMLETSRLSSRSLIIKWVVFVVLAAASTLLTPYGFTLYAINFDMVAGNQTMPFITEWQPFSATRDDLMELGLLAAIGGLIAMRAHPGWARVLFILFALHMFLTHVRFVYVFFLLTPLVVASAAAARNPAIARGPDGQSAKGTWPLATSLAALVIAGFIGFAWAYPFEPQKRRSVEDAIAYVRANGLTGPVVNGYNLGGVLIFNGFKTFLDGRTEQLFDGQFMVDYLAAGRPGGEEVMRRILDQHKAEWTIFPKRDIRNRHIAAAPGWSKAYEDDYVIIHVRSAPQ